MLQKQSLGQSQTQGVNVMSGDYIGFYVHGCCDYILLVCTL